RTDSSVFWDWLPHHLSIAHVVCKSLPDSVRTFATTEQGGVCDSATVAYQFGGTLLTCHMSWRSPEKKKIWTFVGERGLLTFNDIAEQKLMLTVDGVVSHPSYDPE